MRILTTPALCLALALSTTPTIAGETPCYCRDTTGQHVQMGELRCLTVGGRTFLALCDMSLNTMTWREQSEGCPSS
jgi:hypothetical protein